MLRPMEVPINVSQIDRAKEAMAEFARSTRDAGAAARAIRMPAASAPGGAMSIRRQGAIAAAATSAQAMQVRARAALTTAQVRADTQAMRAQAAQAVAARQLNRALSPVAGRAPATPEQRIAQAVLSSRFSAQGIQPLVGRTLAAAGIQGPEAAKFGIAFGAISLAAAAVQRFGKFVAEASERVHQFGIATTISGGTGAQVARLRGMGVPVGEIAGASAGLRGRLASDPMAMMAGMRLGIGPVLPRPFGGTNEAVILQRALEGLRKITDAEQQLRLARMLGLETMLDQIRVSDDVWNRGKALAAVNATIYDARTLQTARDLAGEQRNLQASMENLGGTLAKTWIKPLQDLTATGATAAGAIAKAGSTPQGTSAMQIATAIGLWFSSPFGPAAALAYLAHQEGPGKGGGSGDPHATAQDASIQALKDLTAQLYKMNQNLGGGPRTSGADPGRLAGSQLGNPDVYGKMDSAERDRRMREVEAQRYGPWAR